MRKLKLQMQVSIDGFVAGPNGEMDWMQWNWDADLLRFVSELTEPVDTILLGRKLAEGFIPSWKAACEKPETANAFAHKMNDTPKIVFSKTLKTSDWANTEIVNGNIIDEVNRIKARPGKDIIVYGGAHFVSNLILAGLIDEFHLSVNPTALGSGMKIFEERTQLELVKSHSFECGKVVLQYQPKK